MKNFKWSRLLALPAWLALTHGAGAAGTLAMAWTEWSWYRSLINPPIKPPDWVFGPVWATLYTLMAVSMWLASQAPLDNAGKRHFRRTRLLFICQLLLNSLWMWLFFFLRLPVAAVADAVALLTILFIICLRLRHYGKAPALLFLPYPAWLLYIAVLTVWMLFLNYGA